MCVLRAANACARAVQVHMTSEARRLPGTPFSPRYLNRNGGRLGGESSHLQMLTVRGPNWERYHQTKLANALFTYALHDKLQACTSPCFLGRWLL